MERQYVSNVSEWMSDWDFERNKQYGNHPDKISIGSHKRVFWKCHICGGLWDTVMKERLGCPYCTGLKALAGYNDLATTHPMLAKDWDAARNGQLTPQMVTAGSKKKVYWKCEKGHSWDMYVYTRIKGQDCPYCRNRRVLVGYNDLATLRPDLAKEWNTDKNEGLTVRDVIPGSKKKVWWICEKGHEWQAQVIHRNNGTGCPICANKIVVKDYNDFGTEHPELLKEWDYEKNERSPYSYPCFSKERVWWICKKGHSFKAVIGDRCRGNGCPKCSEELKVSFPEKVLLFYIKQKIENVQANYRASWLGKFELDIFLEDYNVAVEYDGYYGHSKDAGIKRDLRKNLICAENGVALIRIREPGCPSLQSSSHDYLMAERNDLFCAIQFVFRMLQQLQGDTYVLDEKEYDIARDSGEIYSLIEYTDKANSIHSVCPEIEAMWHPSKNGALKPEYVSIGSSKKVWWLGKCGHEWRSTVSYEVISGKCPYCSGMRVLAGYNDLATINPELAKEWDAIKNGAAKAGDYTAGSGKKVWWKCIRGHSWKASIVSRNRGNGCPICSNHELLPGYNDVGGIEELALDWNYEKNGQLSPTQVCIGSRQKVWWKCRKCNYEWQAAVDGRVAGRKCPVCAGKERINSYYQGITEKRGALADSRADLMEEWDWEENFGINPQRITAGYGKKVWWICKKCNHKWAATVISRSSGRGCPLCGRENQRISRRQTLLKNKSSLAVSHPYLVEEWLDSQNGIWTPDNVTAGSGRRVWWKCRNCGSTWEAAICDRTRGKGKCKVCRA